ncbi:trypsin-like peptidase domain-containing protein [Streptomycetaceae bacterium NBC_01309]
MTVDAGVWLRPVVSWPQEIEAGRNHLVTVDVELDDAQGEWPYESEEYAIACVLDGPPGLSVSSVGDTTLVVHRFGGTYGPVRFVVRASQGAEASGDLELTLTLVTAGGVPFRTIPLPLRGGGSGGADEASEQAAVELESAVEAVVEPESAVAPVRPESPGPATPFGSGRRRRQPALAERVVRVRARTPGGPATLRGSGCIVAAGLVLTAAHVVHGGSDVEVVGTGEGQWVRGRVVWSSEDVDVALVEVPLGQELAPVRWGRSVTATSAVPCEVAGMGPRPRPTDPPTVEVYRGDLRGTRGGSRGSLHIEMRSSPHAEQADRRGAWRGFAGSPVYCGDVLAGVVTAERVGTQTLVGCPAVQLHRITEFTDILARYAGSRRVDLEPLEWLAFAEPPAAPRLRRSPADLLRARDEVVPFCGRSAELNDLMDWAGEDGLDAWLLHGPGGEGKTRLAHELGRRLTAEGWAVLWLDAGADPRDFDAFRDILVPALLVVDYAETRTAQLRQLIRVLMRSAGEERVKLLMLARTAGAWWRSLSESTTDAHALLADAPVVRLSSLVPGVEESREAYDVARDALAAALSEAGGRTPSAESASVRRGATPGQSALDVHTAALLDLLDADSGTRRPASSALSSRLLAHERRYWQATAQAVGIGNFSQETLEDALMVAAAVPAENRLHADELLRIVPGLADQPRDRRDAVRMWIAGMYPASDHRPWGQMQPDRLTEQFWAGRVSDNPAVGAEVLAHAAATGRTEHAFLLVGRLIASDSADAGPREAVTRIVTADADTLLEPLMGVVDRVPDPEPVRDVIRASLQHGKLTPSMARRLSDKYLGADGPVGDLALAIANAAQRCAPVTDSPYYSIALSNVAGVLIRAGRFDEAREAGTAARKGLIWGEQGERIRPSQFRTAAVYFNEAQALAGSGSPEEALPAAVAAARAFEEVSLRESAHDHPHVAMAWHLVASLYRVDDHPDDAAAALAADTALLYSPLTVYSPRASVFIPYGEA